MKMIWIPVGMVVAGLMSFTACGNGTTGTGPGTGGGAAGTGGSANGPAGTGGSPGTGGAPGVDCQCACHAGSMAALVCNDSAHPSYCAGMAPVAGGMCEKALKSDCMFTDADISALGCTGTM